MGSKPKAQDYKPSDSEKASAAVAMAEHKYFKKKYDPLLQKMRDASKTDDSADVLRGRANADTMQTLAGKANYQAAASGDAGGDMAKAYQAQLGQADKAGLQIKNNMQLGVLGTARGQAADAQTGMAQAANLGASKVLTQAKAKQDVKSAKNAALGQLATAVVMQGGENMKSSAPATNTNGTPIMKGTGANATQATTQGSFFKNANNPGMMANLAAMF